MQQYEILTLADKPALLGISTLECQVSVMAALDALGYKVHVAQDQDDFMSRFTQYQYQVTVIEETFYCNGLADNQAYQFLKNLPMNLRRHSTIFLLSDACQTLNSMQAFALSVHAVVNSADFANLNGILAKVVNDNDLFLAPYRQTQERLAQGQL